MVMQRHSSGWGGALAGAISLLGASHALCADASSVLDSVQLGARITELDVESLTTYNSNVVSASADVAKLRGLSVDDLFTASTARATIARPIGGLEAAVDGEVGYRAYYRDTVLNSFSYRVQPMISARVNRCRVGADASFDQRLRSFEDQSLASQNGGLPVVITNVVTAYSAEGNVDCNFSQKFRPSLLVSRTWQSSSAASGRLQDTNVLSVQPSLAFGRPEAIRVNVFGSVQKIDYPGRANLQLGTPVPSGNDYYLVGVSLAKSFANHLIVTGGVSYLKVTSAGVGVGFSGVNYTGNLTYIFSPALSVDAGAARQVVPSNQFGSEFSLQDSVNIKSDYKLSRRLSVSIFDKFMHQAYLGVFAPQALNFHHFDRNAAGGDLRLALGSRWVVRLGYTDTRRVGDNAPLSFDDQQVYLSFAVKI